MYGPPNNPFKPSLNNPVEVYRGIGWAYDTLETTYIQSFDVVGRVSTPPYDCWASYGIQNTSCNGAVYAYGYGLGTNATGAPRSFYKMYLDPNFIYIRNDCITESDTPRAEKCDFPGMSVWTRKMPKDITPLEANIIRDILDDRLQMYCMTSKDMVLVNWFDLPPCDYPPKPQLALDDYKRAQENWVTKCYNPDGGSCSVASYY